MKVNVEKAELVAILTKNRTAHRAVFEKAMENFRKHALGVFEANIARIKDGKLPERVVSFNVPTDQTRDYDRAIGMLQIGHMTQTLIELSESDYTKYVLDQWDWSRSWKAVSNTYGHVVDDEDDL